MGYIDFKENKRHGSTKFPFAYYPVTERDPRYKMQAHWHEEFEVIRILKGNFELRINNYSYTVKKNDIIFVHGGFIHSGTPADCEYECLVFSMHGLLKQNILSNNELNEILENQKKIQTIFSPEDGMVHSILSNIFDTIKKREQGYTFKVYGALYYFLGMVEELNLYTKEDSVVVSNVKFFKQIKKVISFIQDNYMKDIGLEEMAKIAHMSDKYFCSFFKKMTGKSPVDYLNFYRIECACAQIKFSHRQITEIAFACGFNDVSYFTKVFKKYQGITPREYLKGAH